jgi:hypothetical protein
VTEKKMFGGVCFMLRDHMRYEGFVWVDAAKCDARGLKSWVALAEKYVAGLPAKKARRR